MANEYLPGTITVPTTLLVTNITNAQRMVVTVDAGSSSAFLNNYQTGMAVRLNIPIAYGMFQANGLIGTITNVSGADLTLDIDSSTFDTFVYSPGTYDTQPSSITPSGSRNYQYNNTSQKVPFQSYNNQGN